MKAFMYAFLMVALLAAVSVHAEDFSEAQSLIDSGVSCDSLTDDQLELIGDYYMEQMHPGGLHEIMDARMGGEGSESLRLVHIRMAQSFYCGDDSAQGGMMGSNSNSWGGMGSMMGAGYGYSSARSSFNLYNILLVLLIVLAALAIVWISKQIFSNQTGKTNKKR